MFTLVKKTNNRHPLMCKLQSYSPNIPFAPLYFSALLVCLFLANEM